MQEWYLNQNSLNPSIRLELINDGRHDYRKAFEALQNCSITFTMINRESGVTKIAKAPAYIKKKETGGCVEEYVICYDWRKRDVNEAGNYIGYFDIEFGEIKNDEYTYPSGNLIVPIREQLMITIRELK